MTCAFASRPRAVQVQRVVLLSPARGYGAAGNEQESQRVRRGRLEALDTKGVSGLAAAIDQRLLSAAADDSARQWVRWNTARLHEAGYRQAVEMLCNSELAALAPGIPVEVHCGDADVVTPPDSCRAAALALNAPFDLIANAGHASPVEQPEAVARILMQALQAIQPGGQGPAR
jgi:pimeloyl-ACP methyl ester carboxylesterase